MVPPPLRPGPAGRPGPAAQPQPSLEQQLEPLNDVEERVLRTWQPEWTPFLEPRVWREAQSRFQGREDLRLSAEGGYEGALRCRLLLWRPETEGVQPVPPPGLMGLELTGNFLFDPATTAQMRDGLLQAGASPGEVGDLWLRGDRGAQAVISEELAAWLDGCLAQVSSVEVRFTVLPLAELRFPPKRVPRDLHSVEASLRIDAVGSAGFGVSRTRMAALIRQGAMRVDGRQVSSPSQVVAPGQCLQLEGRGELQITDVAPTQRGRWRLAMLRR